MTSMLRRGDRPTPVLPSVVSMSDDSERLRLLLTFGLVALGIAVVLIAFLVAVFTFKDKDQAGQSIPAIVGTVTAAVGTLVGLIAGHAAGAAGKEGAERRADASEQQAVAGRTLATTLKEEEAGLQGAAPAVEAFGPGDPANAAAIHRHAALAKRLFPDE
jgi:hypothetical protein